MKTGSTNTNKFKPFQIRWKEKLGYKNNPYLIRWTFIFFGYSIRVHHWLKSDDDRFYHDHSANLISIVLRGKYWNVIPRDSSKNPSEEVSVPFFQCDDFSFGGDVLVKNERRIYVEGIFNSWKNFFNAGKSIWHSKAERRHYLSIPEGGAWTLMFEGRPHHTWGFYVNGHKWRPLRYFHKYGIRQDLDYQ